MATSITLYIGALENHELMAVHGVVSNFEFLVMKIRFISLILVVWCTAGWADFSDALFQLHPAQPMDGEPYLIVITGEWPTDCHPGEQKPVIRDYTGDTALIEFETIVEHVTCNDVVTPYRVLIDMSDVTDSVTGAFFEIEVLLRFDGTEFTKLLTLICICSPVPVGPQINPEAGLYDSVGLEKQGLLLARQNQRMAVYPLIYDDSGSSEWLIGPGGIDEDVFFSELFELTGGQCLGCPPPDEPPELNEVGKLTLLMDSQGLVQMKINDGLFITYEQSEFGYGGFEILDADGETLVRVPDLSGRWAFSDDESDFNETTPPPTSVLPLVFDVTLRSNVTDPPPPTIGTPPPVTGPRSNVFYSILNMDGEQVAQMLCEYRDEMVCDLKTPDIEIGDYDEWYKVQLLSVERMIITNTEPLVTEEYSGTGTAVRID